MLVCSYDRGYCCYGNVIICGKFFVYQTSMNVSLVRTVVMSTLCASILFRAFLALVGLATLEME